MIDEAINSLNNLNIKKQLIGIMLIILMTDLFIVFDIPILRQVFGFLCFTIIPGFLIVAILRLDKLGFAEKFVLSVGLSVAFLMFVGLLINEVYYAFGYKTPLSTYSLMISFSLIMFGLLYCTYKRNRDKNFTTPKLELKNTTGRLLFLIPLAFPVLSVLGSYFMNTQDNNIITLLLLLLIPIYIILITILKDRDSRQIHLIAILMISMSLVFVYSLRGEHILISDTIEEYKISQIIFDNLYFDVSPSNSTLGACLTVISLPVIFQSLLSINGEYVFKLAHVAVFSITPVIIYFITNRYLNSNYSFLSSFFYMTQVTFSSLPTANSRTAFAVLFFALFIMIFVSNLERVKKKILMIIFVFSIIFSHYSTTFIFLFFLFFSFLVVISFKKIVRVYDKEKILQFSLILLLFVGLFLCYGQIIEAPFAGGVNFAKNTLLSLHNIFLDETRTSLSQTIYDPESGFLKSLPDLIQWILTWACFVVIGVGVVSVVASILFKKYSPYDIKIEYAAFMLVASIILAAPLFPFVSMGYGITRVYIAMLVILSLAFIVGSKTLSKYLKINSHALILILLILLFLCTKGVIYQFFGIPWLIYLNSDGYDYNVGYTHDQEIFAAEWIFNNKKDQSYIYTDMPGTYKLIIYTDIYGVKRLSNKLESNSYIYLRYQTLIDKNIVLSPAKRGPNIENLENYSHLFINKNKIYNNRGSEIYK